MVLRFRISTSCSAAAFTYLIFPKNEFAGLSTSCRWFSAACECFGVPYFFQKLILRFRHQEERCLTACDCFGVLGMGHTMLAARASSLLVVIRRSVMPAPSAEKRIGTSRGFPCVHVIRGGRFDFDRLGTDDRSQMRNLPAGGIGGWHSELNATYHLNATVCGLQEQHVDYQQISFKS